MKKAVSSLIIAALIVLQAGKFTECRSSESNRTGVVLGITIPAAVIAAGTASFFLVRNAVRDRKHGDSLTSYCKAIWDSSQALFANEHYRASADILQNVVSVWDDLERYRRKRNNEPFTSFDSLQNKIATCMLLDKLYPRITQLRMQTDLLPDNADSLVNRNRHQVLAIIKQVRASLDSVYSVHHENTEVVTYGFSDVQSRLDRVDTLFRMVYEQERANFNYKCKFYYNRAFESGDTVTLREFVDDCSYYQIDKEWCTRASIALNAPSVPVKKELAASGVPKKMSATDSMKLEYQKAIDSKQIELLEHYIKKYSKRFRKKVSKVDSVQIVLDSVRRVLEEEIAFNRAYPLFAQAELENLQIQIKGVARIVEEQFTTVLETSREQLRQISGFRFPAILQIDYSGDHPMLFLHAHFNPGKDVEKGEMGAALEYSVKGVPAAMEFLDEIKRNVVAALLTGAVNQDEVQRIRLAAYVVRLRKNRDEYVTFYAKENLQSERGQDPVKFFDFFDLTLRDSKDVRLPNVSSPLIRISEEEFETQKKDLSAQFFGK